MSETRQQKGYSTPLNAMGQWLSVWPEQEGRAFLLELIRNNITALAFLEQHCAGLSCDDSRKVAVAIESSCYNYIHLLRSFVVGSITGTTEKSEQASTSTMTKENTNTANLSLTQCPASGHKEEKSGQIYPACIQWSDGDRILIDIPGMWHLSIDEELLAIVKSMCKEPIQGTIFRLYLLT